MESDDIYKYVGFFIVVLCLIYIIVKTMKFQFMAIEGMTSSPSTLSNTPTDKVPDAISSNTTNIEDSLLLPKYTQVYENTILDLDMNLNMYILQQVLTNAEQISTDPGSDDNQALINKLNNVIKLKDTLNQAIKVLDSK